MNIYLHEIKSIRKYTLIWSISITILCIFFMSLYPTIYKDADAFTKIIQGYPEAVKNAIGLQLENFISPLGFYAFTIVYISMCGAIQALNSGISILSKEIRDKTADFLLTKPVSRNKILTAKILSAITAIVFTNVLFIAISFIMVPAVSNTTFSYQSLFLMASTLFLVQMFFLALGILIGSALSKVKNVLPMSLGITFGLFMIGAFLVTSSDDPARLIAPFKYYDFSYIISNSSYEIFYFILNIIFVIGMIALSYVIYNKREIHAV